jgi:alcohol dehydrogenase
LAHALAETIQIPYKLPHGAVIGVILPHAMSFNMTADPFKYAEMAKAMGVHADGFSEMDLAKKSIEKVRALIKKVGLPEKLSDLGIPKQDIPMIAHLTTDLSPSLLKVNPRVPSEHDLIEILSNAF